MNIKKTFLFSLAFTLQFVSHAQKVINPKWYNDFSTSLQGEKNKNTGTYRFMFQKEASSFVLASYAQNGWLLQKIDHKNGNILWENGQNNVFPDSSGRIFFFDNALINQDGQLEVLGRKSTKPFPSPSPGGYPIGAIYDYETGKLEKKIETSYNNNTKSYFYSGGYSPPIFKNNNEYLCVDNFSVSTQFIIDILDSNMLFKRRLDTIKTNNTDTIFNSFSDDNTVLKNNNNLYTFNFLKDYTSFDTSSYLLLYKKIDLEGKLLFEKKLSSFLHYDVGQYFIAPIQDGFLLSSYADTVFSKTNKRSKLFNTITSKFDFEGNFKWQTFLPDTVGSFFYRSFSCEDISRKGYWVLAGKSYKYSSPPILFFIDNNGKARKIAKIKIPNDNEIYYPRNIWVLQNGDILIGLKYEKCETEFKKFTKCSKLALLDANFLDNIITNDDTKISKILDFILFPNPTQNEITLQLPDNQSGVLSLFNATGQLVKQLPFIDNAQIHVNTEDLSLGIYIARITLDNGYMGSQRFVIQK
jgi:hypothetical protein